MVSQMGRLLGGQFGQNLTKSAFWGQNMGDKLCFGVSTAYFEQVNQLGYEYRY